MSEWMLYGANGYTGELIAREAARRGLHVILAGRNEAALTGLAAELGYRSQVFGLADAEDVVRQLANIPLLLNCAGPFGSTAAALMEACRRSGTHYLDITGEIDVIELAAAQDKPAQQVGVVLLPAVGFDVVPSDCLASMLAAQLPTATHLQLGFTGSGSLSRGTTRTALQTLPNGGRVRVNGRIERVPLAWKTRTIPFAEGTRTAVTIPWGDVASAYYSTGIENIEVYTTISPRQLRLLRWLGWFLPWLPRSLVNAVSRLFVPRTKRGPNTAQRSTSPASLWGRVEDASGRSIEATLITPNGYDLTVLTALASVERILAGNIPSGFHTPSRAFGPEFILSIPGTELRLPAPSQPPRHSISG